MISPFRHWRNYLLIISAVSYGTGIVFRSFVSTSSTLPCQLLLGTVAFCLLLRFFNHRVGSILFMVLSFLLLGMIQGIRFDIRVLEANHIARLITEKQTATLVGTVSQKVSNDADINRIQLQSSFIRTASSKAFVKVGGKVLLTLKGAWPESILPGQSICVLTTLEPPPVVNSPGAFNYRKYLARKHIYLTGTIVSAVLIQPVTMLDMSSADKIMYAIERLRVHISRQIDAVLPDTTAALYKALIVGDRSSVRATDLEDFKRAGVLHILAISGMHLGLLAWLIFRSFYWLIRRSERLLLTFNARKSALLFTLFPLLFYTLLSGSQPPVIRSFVMTLFLVIALSTDRVHSSLTTLAGAALTILLFEPMAIESPSFQLSFTAVFAIVLLTPRLISLLSFSGMVPGSKLYRIIRPLLTLAAVTVAATIGTLPLMLIHFNRVSLVTLPANLCIEPIICLFSLPLGMISVICMPFCPDFSSALLNIGAAGLSLSVNIADFLSQWELSQLWLPQPHLIAVLLFYLFFISFSVPSSHRSHQVAKLAGLLITTTCFALPLLHISFGHNRETRISVLAVGHGSANVMQLQDGRVILIDGGARSAPGYDCGERIIAPFLWHHKIARIDDVIITHDDADHYNGLGAIITRFKPERLWLPYLDSDKNGFNRLIKMAERTGVKTIIADQRVLFAQDRNKISVLGQSLRLSDKQAEDDKGLVLKLDTGEVSMIFPGDITRLREQELISEEPNLAATFLLSAHHGSSSSNSYEFLAQVHPEYLLFSTSAAGSNLFPSRATLQNAELLGLKTLNTAVDGSVTITIPEGGTDYHIATYDISRQKFWRES